MAEPAKIDLNTVRRGDTYVVDFFFTDTDGTKDISAVTIDAQARKEMDGTLWFDLKPIVVDASNGHFRIHLTHEETRQLTEAPPNSFSGIYDIQFSWAGANETYVSTIVAGSISISKDVTQVPTAPSGDAVLQQPTNQEINVYYSLYPGSPNYSDVVTAEQLTPVQYNIAASLGLANIDYVNEAGVAAKVAKDAAEEAKGYRDQAKQSEQIATIQASKATTEAANAKKSADDAVAVVTGGTASLSPEPGKIPLADSEGKIDDGWLSSVAKYCQTEADMRRMISSNLNKFAACGFVEYGKHYSSGAQYSPINEGLWTRTNSKNLIVMGRGDDAGGAIGESASDKPILHVAGVLFELAYLGLSSSAYYCAITVPEAPDGTVTYNVDTGEVVKHLNQSSAFSSETATIKVVTDRFDLITFEVFLEEITPTNDDVYPRGVVQCRKTGEEDGVSLTSGNRPQSYYAAFPEDSWSTGNRWAWSTLTDEQKASILSNPRNNIFLLDDGRLVQWRVRQRAIEGRGNGDWGYVSWPENDSHWVGFDYVSSADYYIHAQGVNNQVSQSTEALFKGRKRPDFKQEIVGAFHANSSETSDTVGVNGECYLYVADRVSRLNKGAFHLSFNPMGTAQVWNIGHSNNTVWYNSSAMEINSKEDCFKFGDSSDLNSVVREDWGSLSVGESGRDDGRFYDAIYSSGVGGVLDDRLSAWNMDSPEEASKVNAKILNNVFRGEEKLPLTKVFSSASLVPSGWTVVNNDDPSAVVATTLTNNSVEGNFYCTEVVGDPARIVQIDQLSDGWIGYWCKDKPTVDVTTYKLTRKKLGSELTSAQYTDDNGGVWSMASYSVDRATNSFTAANASGLKVMLVHYLTSASVTEDDDNSPVFNANAGIGPVLFLADNRVEYGASLANSLINDVVTADAAGVRSYQAYVDSFFIRYNSNKLYSSSVYAKTITHGELLLSDPGSNTFAVKALSRQISENLSLKLGFSWNEIKFDGTDWGDDSSIKIEDSNKFTYTNLNAETCLAGASKLSKPYGYGKNHARFGTQEPGVDL